MSRASVVVSLPDAKPALGVSASIPRMGERGFLLESSLAVKKRHEFDGEHYWEINKLGFDLKKIVGDFELCATLVRTFRVINHPYYRFLVFDKLRNL